MIKNITESMIYVGADDHELDLFEGQYSVPDGMAYNSYVILDEKNAVIDTIDRKKTDEWLDNVEKALNGGNPDYLIIQHMEPDHSASIGAFMEKYPDTIVVGNKKTFNMIGQFFPGMEIADKLVVGNEDTLSIGSHQLKFMLAPMVHWPEVMMTYESSEKVLFSADAFGKFGALDVEDEWACEARRYYIGIVGKFGTQVQNILKKLPELDIQMICPLHGPVLRENLDEYIGLYDTWSSYRHETEGVCICYTSVYGNTRQAVELLEKELKDQGVETVVVNDLARCDMAEAVEDAFRYDRLVLATTTYNGEIFPFMKQFIDHLTERNYQKRTVGFIENGSWAPMAMKTMKKALEGSKDITTVKNNVTILSSLNDESKAQIKALACEIAACKCDDQEDGEKKETAGKIKGYVCGICGYVYEGDVLPDDFVCPLCRQGREVFSPIE